MIARVIAFVGITATLAVLGFYATFFVSLGDCGMGPDAQQSCYDRQTPRVWATVAVFATAEIAAAVMIVRRRKGE
jgi:hypothetical protein